MLPSPLEVLTQSNARRQRGDQPLNDPGNCTSQVLTSKNKLSVWELGSRFYQREQCFLPLGRIRVTRKGDLMPSNVWHDSCVFCCTEF